MMMVGVGCDLLAFDKTALLVFDNGEDALLEIDCCPSSTVMQHALLVLVLPVCQIMAQTSYGPRRMYELRGESKLHIILGPWLSSPEGHMRTILPGGAKHLLLSMDQNHCSTVVQNTPRSCSRKFGYLHSHVWSLHLPHCPVNTGLFVLP